MRPSSTWAVAKDPSMSAWPQTLVLVGAGKMGGAMLRGWLAGGLPAAGVALIDPAPAPEMVALAASHGMALNPAEGALAAPDVLVLAVKPQMLDSAAPRLAALAGPDTMTLSIMAGKTIADIRTRLPHARAFVRVMPNTPAAVGRGAAAGFANGAVTALQRVWAERLMRAVGMFDWLEDEGLIDAVTAISGSGPAYVFALVEAMARAGEAVGLPADLAMRLARATVEGAGELLHREPEVPASRLRINVTSPAGTTAAALAVLQAPDGLDALMARAAAAAHRRARELAG
jgi:pyrroline-5-carboxylate reductase